MPGIGIPSLQENLPPIVKRNYGQWVYHEVPRPGVLKHVARSGEACYTVRAAMPICSSSLQQMASSSAGAISAIEQPAARSGRITR